MNRFTEWTQLDELNDSIMCMIELDNQNYRVNSIMIMCCKMNRLNCNTDIDKMIDHLHNPIITNIDNIMVEIYNILIINIQYISTMDNIIRWIYT